MSEAVIELRTERWLNFYKGTGSRILYLINVQEETPARPWPRPDLIAERLEWAWNKYCSMVDRLEWLDDDSIPYLDVYTGTEIFAEAFGSKIHYSEDNMPFALPAVSSWQEAENLRIPDLTSSPLNQLLEMMDDLRHKAAGRGLVKMVDMQSPMDISALIWDKNTFYAAMIENPEAVKVLSSRVHEFLVQFLDTWYQEFGPSFLAHYPDYYVPYGITLSEDEIGAVNPEMFDQFFLPELVALSERYGQMGIHCCAHARHQWSSLLKIPGVFMLNLVQPEHVLIDAYRFFSPHCAQMHNWVGQGEPWTWPGQLPAGARAVLTVEATSRSEAIETGKRMREAVQADNVQQRKGEN